MRLIAIAAGLVLLSVSAGCGNAAHLSASRNGGGNGRVVTVSCGRPGDCAAGGSYRDGPNREAFVVGERNGRWGKPMAVPGTTTLNAGGDAAVDSISCAPRGQCAAGGYYSVDDSHSEAFVASETNGRWGEAVEVPGMATLNSDGFASVLSISCAAPGACAAGGYYRYGRFHYRAFVVSETNGHWGRAITVPGTRTLIDHRQPVLLPISCAAPGECAAGGNDDAGAFVVDETKGRWGQAITVPYTESVDSISCPAAGGCAAAVDNVPFDPRAYVVSETHGRWGRRIEVSGFAGIEKYTAGGGAGSISCAMPGECALGGVFDDDEEAYAFVASEANGSWGRPVRKAPPVVPVIDSKVGYTNAISCAAPGECAAGGGYSGSLQTSDGYEGPFIARAFVVSESHGSWGKGIMVRGMPMRSSDFYAGVTSISCAAAGECAAGGYITDRSGRSRAFVVDESKGSWGSAIRVRNFPAT